MTSTAAEIRPSDLRPFAEHLSRLSPGRRTGSIVEAVGLTVEVAGLSGTVGELVLLPTAGGQVPAEIVGFRGARALLMPLGELSGLTAGAEVEALGRPLTVTVGDDLLDRVLDGLGRPADGKGPVSGHRRMVGQGAAPDPLTRRPVDRDFPTGVRVIGGLLTCGSGQQDWHLRRFGRRQEHHARHDRPPRRRRRQRDLPRRRARS
jgi:flagellar biosynthesis/type III secretory pathway ATPase